MYLQHNASYSYKNINPVYSLRIDTNVVKQEKGEKVMGKEKSVGKGEK